MSFSDHIALLPNPAPQGEKARQASAVIAALLDARGITYTSFAQQWPESLDGFSAAWIVGGDGTLNWFINQFPDTGLPLALFAAGSGNDFHAMFYDEMSLEEQGGHMLQGRSKWVDAGSCNEKLFLNGVGIGFDGAIVHDLLGRKKMAGKASYLLSILKQIATYHEKKYTIRFDGQEVDGPHLMISVANGYRYGGGFQVAPRADLTDGLLDLNLVGSISPLRRIQYLPVIEKGEHLALPFVRYAQTASVEITTPKSVHAHIDGEYLCTERFSLRALPARFRFLY